jgi:putative FmdB family regulatory protein
MPYYDYYCTQCKKTFTKRESMQQHMQRRSTKCEKCGSTRTRRVLQPAFVVTSKKS